ncbi:MAG: YfhO family protein, partial [Armatimonadota bacterium]|nr:YfhO family protein [Armatimonadota bacterium]
GHVDRRDRAGSGTSEPSSLRLTDKIADPGWRFTVDGQRVKPVAADDLFWAVPVNAGTHTITMRYEPTPIRLGLYLTCLAWGLAAALLLPKAAWKTRHK